MSGRELEGTLTLIDQNIQSTQKRVWDDVMSYLRTHEDEAVEQLNEHQRMVVPTTFGPRTISLQEFESWAK
jgi:hypothetical protein